MYFLWELQSVFVRLKFTTKVEWDKQNDQIKKAHLIIDYQEPAELTDCTLSLIDAAQLYPSGEDELIELNLIDRGTIKWQSSNNNSDCKIELPPAPESRTEICIATFQGRLRFNYCSGAHGDSGTGVFLVKLRLDGKLRGKSIRPRFFNGYLYANNVTYIFEAVETITQELPDGTVNKQTQNIKEPKIVPTIIFEVGDWTKDKRIPEEFRRRKIIYGDDKTSKTKTKASHNQK